MSTFSKYLDEALEQIQRIPLEKCHQEDEGLYVYASPEAIEQNLGAVILYVSDDQLEKLVNENPDEFDVEKIRQTRPDENGLYYLPDLSRSPFWHDFERSPHLKGVFGNS
jgi:hypothetical protein